MALLRNATSSLESLPTNRKAIGCQWVFRIKENSNWTIQKYKAQLVVKGFYQLVGFDFLETFNFVVKSTTIRVILTLAFSKGWNVRQLDINNAFLNGTFQEEIYMVQPLGFEDPKCLEKVYKLHNPLYGLKQAPRA